MIQWRDLLNTAMNLEMPAELGLYFKVLENIDGWKFPLGLYSTKFHKTISLCLAYHLHLYKFVHVIQFYER
jgi:hypothetical protein